MPACRVMTIPIVLILSLFSNVYASGTENVPSSDQLVRKVMLDGVEFAIAKYGKEGGFYNDPRVRLPMPEGFSTVEKMVRRFGGNKLADLFIYTLNKTAEKALVSSGPVLKEYIRTMPIENSQGLVSSGSNQAIGDYFAKQSQSEIPGKILPVIQQASETHGLLNSLRQLLEKVRLVRMIHKLRVKMDKAIFKAVFDVVVLNMKLKK